MPKLITDGHYWPDEEDQLRSDRRLLNYSRGDLVVFNKHYKALLKETPEGLEPEVLLRRNVTLARKINQIALHLSYRTNAA